MAAWREVGKKLGNTWFYSYRLAVVLCVCVCVLGFVLWVRGIDGDMQETESFSAQAERVKPPVRSVDTNAISTTYVERNVVHESALDKDVLLLRLNHKDT